MNNCTEQRGSFGIVTPDPSNPKIAIKITSLFQPVRGSSSPHNVNVASNYFEGNFAAMLRDHPIDGLIHVHDVSIHDPGDKILSSHVAIHMAKADETVRETVNRMRQRKCSIRECVDVVDLVLRKVTTGLHHMHRRGFVHCDIKADNVVTFSHLLSNRVVVTDVSIIDFGATRQVGHIIPSCVLDGARLGITCLTTLSSCAPEVLMQGRHPTTLCDAFSLGILLYLIITSTDFVNENDLCDTNGLQLDAHSDGRRRAMYLRMTNRLTEFHTLPKNRLTPFPNPVELSISDHLICMVRGLLDPDPAKRLTIAHLYDLLNLPSLPHLPSFVFLPFAPKSDFTKTYFTNLINDVFDMAELNHKAYGHFMCVEVASRAANIALRYAHATWDAKTTALAEGASQAKAAAIDADVEGKYANYSAKRRHGIINYAYNWVIEEEGRPDITHHEIRACLVIAIAAVDPDHNRFIDPAQRAPASIRTMRVIVRILDAIRFSTYSDTPDWILIREHRFSHIDYKLMRSVLILHHGDEKRAITSYLEGVNRRQLS